MFKGFLVQLFTVNLTDETLVLHKNFPNINQGFSQHYAEKVGNIGFVTAKGKDFPSIKPEKSCFAPEFHQSRLQCGQTSQEFQNFHLKLIFTV